MVTPTCSLKLGDRKHKHALYIIIYIYIYIWYTVSRIVKIRTRWKAEFLLKYMTLKFLQLGSGNEFVSVHLSSLASLEIWKGKLDGLFLDNGIDIAHRFQSEERINVYFNEATGGRYVPRAVLMDLEPGGLFGKKQSLNCANTRPGLSTARDVWCKVVSWQDATIGHKKTHTVTPLAYTCYHMFLLVLRSAREPDCRHHGQCSCWTFRPALPSRQLRLRSNRSRKQLGKGTLHWGGWVDWLSSGCGSKGGWRLRLPSRISALPFPWWRHWCRHGNLVDLQGARRVPRSYHGNILRDSFAKGVGHGGGTIQRIFGFAWKGLDCNVLDPFEVWTWPRSKNNACQCHSDVSICTIHGSISAHEHPTLSFSSGSQSINTKMIFEPFASFLTCLHSKIALSILACWTDQGSLEFPSAGGELWWVLPVGQRSIVRHLLPHFEADHANIWWPEPFGVCSYERRDLLPAFPRTAELRLAQDCSEPCAIPTFALLHDWLCTIDLPWFSAVSCTDCSRADPADAQLLEEHPLWVLL